MSKTEEEIKPYKCFYCDCKVKDTWIIAKLIDYGICPECYEDIMDAD